MIKNFFKIAWRNLLRNKGFSIINISGLAIGMAAAVLILLWIQNELSYDQFHEKKDRIYEAWNKAHFSGKLNCWNTTPKILARTIEKDIPEIERSVRVNWGWQLLFTIGDNRLNVNGNMVDTGFFDMFSFPFVKGNPKTALNGDYSLVLTQKAAKKIFGNEDAMGKVVKVDNKENYTVTGIVKDLPNNTRFNFEYLMNWSYLRRHDGDDSSWGNNSTRTYVLLKENTSFASANEKIKGIKVKYDKEEDDAKWEMFLYPSSRWRLYSSFTNGKEDGGLIDFVKLFGIIALFILLIACINFMNLSTARSEKRAKEVGIRKVVGAQKKSLIGQFIGESILLSFLAGVVALCIVVLVLPAFGELTDKKLAIDFGNAYFWMASLGFILLTGILAGSYPAFFLSSFQPVKVLKGTFKAANALITPRKMLVVLQFTFAIILIICTTIVKQQIDHAQNRQSGYNRDNLVYHFLNGDIEKHYMAIKNELLSSGLATSVTKTSAPLTQGWSDSWGFEWDGKDPNDKTDFDRYCADDKIVKTAGLKLKQGRDFNLAEFPTDSSAMIINESALKTMKFKDPIGKIVKDDGKEYHIVGVVEDFILSSPYHPTKPMIIEGAQGWFNVMHFKLNPANTTADNLKKAEAIFKKYNPEYPFEYKFIDEEYANKFKAEQRTGTLAAIFASLAIFISCLGLFGLATYMAENRIKEIGVRKVLGASVAGITTLLSKDFLKLVMISFVLACPVAWWMMHKWLQDYPYHVNIQWTVFAIAALLSFLISVLTVSYQSIKAAIANPVRSLRTE